MVKEESPASNFDSIKKKTTDLFLSIIGAIEESDIRHVNAIVQLQKGGTALKNTFQSMKQYGNVEKLEPVIKHHYQNIDKQRRFFSTTKRRKKTNIRFAKPTDEDRKEFLTQKSFASVTKNSESKVDDSGKNSSFRSK